MSTQHQNQNNGDKYASKSSGYKGVSWDRHSNRWRAQITINHRQIYLGRWKTKEAAAEAIKKYCQAPHN